MRIKEKKVEEEEDGASYREKMGERREGEKKKTWVFRREGKLGSQNPIKGSLSTPSFVSIFYVFVFLPPLHCATGFLNC